MTFVFYKGVRTYPDGIAGICSIILHTEAYIFNKFNHNICMPFHLPVRYSASNIDLTYNQFRSAW